MTGMVRWIIGILVVMLLAAIVGADCLTCGQGDSIRRNIREMFNSRTDVRVPERVGGKLP